MKASINLLPNEYAITEKQQKKFAVIQITSIIFMFVVFLITSIIVALSIIESKNISNVHDKINKLEKQVDNSKGKEEALYILKDRLNNISKILNSPSKQLVNYNYTEDNLPAGVVLTTVSSDQSGSLVLALLVPNANLLGNLIGVLTNPAAFEKFKQVNIENLARGQDGVYKVNLRIIPK